MTMHIHYNHKCPRCQTDYIPYDKDVACPKCELIETKRFDFVTPVAQSALYNLSQQGSYVPGGWWTGTLGDHLAYFVFQVLDMHKRSKEVSFSMSASSYFWTD